MPIITFLTISEILNIHRQLIKKYGGSFGMRDKNLLISALAQPQVTFQDNFLHNSIHKMAAAYIASFVKHDTFLLIY